MAKRKAKKAKKNGDVRYLKKGESCGKGWTSVEIKVGKRKRRACIRGKVKDIPGFWDRMANAVILVGDIMT